MRPERKSACLMTFGSILVVIGAVLAVFWPSIFFATLKSLMTLSPNSASYGIWRDIPIPMYMEFHMFNISNMADVMAGKNVTLEFEEFGPYVYRESQKKTNLTWNDNGTVTYYNERFWHFQPDMSNGSLTDVIYSINPIVATVAYVLRDTPTFFRVPVDVFMRMYHEHMFINATVSEWLFDGIDDPIIDIAMRFPDLPINIPFDKFGWFYARNGSIEYDGSFLMNTGENDFSQLGNLEKWRYSNETLYRDECGAVKGSTGELWAPELGQPEITVFAPDICTYMTLSKTGPMELRGIEGMNYAANDSLFDNGYKYPSKACYCDEVRDANCLPSGALNVSSCRFGAPAFVTQPHFLNMDPYYASKVKGLNPKPDMNFELALEMYTGMPLRVAAQLQINLLIRHIRGFSLNNQLPDPDTLVPMFWFRQEVRITEDYASLARLALSLRSGIPYGLYALTGLGLLLLVGGIYVLMRKLLKSNDPPILDSTLEDEPRLM
ncbi:protein croquemort-like [Melitaea cinxia]|uniref:protein croquemort-like n=1 Tax=Melitaea cinxia TaxID=113334 RepID=UPI001E2749CE|nr:protein croquemort-like [Melitaea cinxia]